MTMGYAARSKLAHKVQSFGLADQLRLIRVTMVVAFAVIVVKIVAMGKDIGTAATFGTSDSADAFLIAMVLPSFLGGLAGGSFEAALVPTFVEVKMRQGADAAHRLLGTVSIAAIGLLFALTGLLAVTGRSLLPFVGNGFTAEKTLLTWHLLLVLLPIIVMGGIATLWTSVLVANGQVAVATLSGATVPLVSAAALLLAHRLDAYALALGVVGGYIVQLAILAWAIVHTGVPLLPRWGGVSPEVRIVARQYAPMVVAGLLLTTAPLIDQTMLAGLNSGSVSQFYYGTKVVSFPVNVAALAVSTAVLPHFSRLVAANDWLGIRRTLKLYGGAILLVTLPVTLLIMLQSREIVKLLFERGEFSATSAHTVSQVQIMSALQIPFYTLSILCVRLISSLRMNKILMWGTGISFFVNIIGDYVLRAFLGAPGIALATTLVYVVSFTFLAFMLRRVLIQREQA